MGSVALSLSQSVCRRVNKTFSCVAMGKAEIPLLLLLLLRLLPAEVVVAALGLVATDAAATGGGGGATGDVRAEDGTTAVRGGEDCLCIGGGGGGGVRLAVLLERTFPTAGFFIVASLELTADGAVAAAPAGGSTILAKRDVFSLSFFFLTIPMSCNGSLW